MSARCHVCGAPASAAASRAPGSWLCDDCVVVGDHVVSMRTGAGGSSVAVCQCGWRSEVSGKSRYVVQDAKVRLHWRTMIRAAAAALAEDVRANIGLVFCASIAMSAALGSWLGSLS